LQEVSFNRKIQAINDWQKIILKASDIAGIFSSPIISSLAVQLQVKSVMLSMY
jgi:hypothetical protein